MYVFGASDATYSQQISVVNNCKLKPIKKLPFVMWFGACAQRNDAEVFICFESSVDGSTWKNCHRATGPLGSFTEVQKSTYGHGGTRIAATSGKWSI